MDKVQAAVFLFYKANKIRHGYMPPNLYLCMFATAYIKLRGHGVEHMAQPRAAPH